MFKVGDKVKCVEGQKSQGLIEGATYVVKMSWYNREHFIKVVGLSAGFYQHRFVKVNPFKGNIK